MSSRVIVIRITDIVSLICERERERGKRRDCQLKGESAYFEERIGHSAKQKCKVSPQRSLNEAQGFL